MSKNSLLDKTLSSLETENRHFLEKTTGDSTSRHVPPNTTSLMVLQGEEALCASDQFAYVGSEDATTCVILVLLGNHHVYVAHVDDSTCTSTSSFKKAIEVCTNSGASQAELFLAGAYDDDNFALSRVLQIFQTNPQVTCKLCFVQNLNRDSEGFPRTRALAVHVPTRIPFPYTFAPHCRGPEIYRRHARRQFVHGLVPVINTNAELELVGFTVPSFSPQVYLDNIQLASKDVGLFLEENSTSPLHESDLFVPDIVGSYQWILDHMGTQVVSKIFVWTSNGWTEKTKEEVPPPKPKTFTQTLGKAFHKAFSD